MQIDDEGKEKEKGLVLDARSLHAFDVDFFYVDYDALILNLISFLG